MKQDFNRHGQKLSEWEYTERVVAIYANAPQSPSADQRVAIRRAEMEASIDHNLGLDFPAHRRDEMWRVAEEIERHRWRIPFLTLTEAFKALFVKKDLVPTEEHWSAMAAYLVKKYACVLDAEEIEAYLHLKRDGIVPRP